MFFVDGVRFLPDASHDGEALQGREGGGCHSSAPTATGSRAVHSSAWVFDRDTSHQSPLADTILANLPSIEEVAVGPTFITVRRVDKENINESAAHYFAKHFHGGLPASSPSNPSGAPGAPDDEARALEAMAAQSQSLQGAVSRLMVEEEEMEEGEGRPLRITRKTPATAAPLHDARDEEAAAEELTPEDARKAEEAIRGMMASQDWSELKLHVSALLTDHLYSGRPHIDASAPHPHADTLPCADDTEVVLSIKELIATFIRPQLQSDGGDIRFVSFEAPTLHIELLGACRRCKSSDTTLKQFIERTTRHWIPEVENIIEISRQKGGAALEELRT